MSLALYSARHSGRPAAEGFLAQCLHRVLDTIAEWHQRATSRHELAQLDDRMLQDIGVSGADVEREIAKPFWRA